MWNTVITLVVFVGAISFGYWQKKSIEAALFMLCLLIFIHGNVHLIMKMFQDIFVLINK